jgi:gliding motility-associated-like protein
MKVYLYILLTSCLSITPFLGNAQNLVPNPSFEDTVNCPTSISQWYNCAGWINPNLAGPDYFNACDNYATGFLGVPNNATGYQPAYAGSAYIGLYLYQRSISGGPFDFREYIQAKLTDTLQQGKKYCISFYVNLATMADIAIDNIGLYISTTAISAGTPTVLMYSPQITSPTGLFIQDTLNWQKITGIYTALGGEQYITIGNFKDANTTDTIHTNPLIASSAYYYLDDVSVICCDCDTTVTPNQSSSLSIPNVFTPNHDGNNDNFTIATTHIKTLTCFIYNRWGILVGSLTGANSYWDGFTTSGIPCNNGVYYYILTATGEDEKQYTQKGFLQLLR